jgi:uncharacterized OB-fold protein
VTFVPATAPRMLPALTDVNRAYWTGGSAGQLLVSRCLDCRRWTMPPADTCPACGGTTEPEAVSGRAEVFTFTVNARQFHPDVPPPNIIAIVQLAEQDDLRIATNLVGCTEAELRCGLPVRVRFEPHGEVYYPVFEPVREAT